MSSQPRSSRLRNLMIQPNQIQRIYAETLGPAGSRISATSKTAIISANDAVLARGTPHLQKDRPPKRIYFCLSDCDGSLPDNAGDVLGSACLPSQACAMVAAPRSGQRARRLARGG